MLVDVGNGMTVCHHRISGVPAERTGLSSPLD
jgi:hypothetical protein